MNIQDKTTQSVAEAVKKVIENKEDFKPHMMYDPKTGKGYEAKTYEDHLKMKDMGYVHEKPSDKEEGNAFGQAVTDAKKAGKKKFKFQGKDYKVEGDEVNEIEIDPATNKLVGAGTKKESVELEEDVTDFRGFKSKDKLVKFTSMAKKLKIKPVGNPIIMKRMGTDYHVQGFEGKVKDIEKAIKVAVEIEKGTMESIEEMFNRLKPDDVRDSYGTIELKYRSSADIRDAEDKLKKAGINVRKSGDTLEVNSDSPAFKKAKITSSFDSSKREKAIMKVLGESVEESVELEEGFYFDNMSAKDKKRLNSIYKEMDKNEKETKAAIKKGDAKKVDKLGDEYHKLRMQVVNFYNEDVELEEALKPADFVKGGDAKVTKREVDGMLSKIFVNTKLAKSVEASKAFKAGEKDAGKNKNPYKSDTADFHLYELGAQSASM